MSLLRLVPREPPRLWPRFGHGARDVAVTARVGRVLGIAFAICFVTGLLSHYQYGPFTWLPEPAGPVWGYRLTQGLHVLTGIATIPLLFVKLWSVFPRLFAWPPVRGVVHGVERLTVAVLISSALVELTTGLLDAANWYPWPWSFVNVHFWLAWVVTGSIALHISVQLPAIRRGLSQPLTKPMIDDSQRDGISRRGVLWAAGAGTGIVALTTVGQVVTPLQPFAWLAIRRPDKAPNRIPINRTAVQAQVTPALADSPSYRLEFSGPRPYSLDLAAIEALPAHTETWPIACVEGWSANGTWTGPRLIDLVERAGGNADSVVVVVSLEKSGAYRASRVEGPHLSHALLATHLNGQRLSLDHGYPLRLIAPDRAGVLNTKWLTTVKIIK